MDASSLMPCIITEKHSNQINALWWLRLTMRDRVKENRKLSHGGPSQREASDTDLRIKALCKDVIESEA